MMDALQRLTDRLARVEEQLANIPVRQAVPPRAGNVIAKITGAGASDGYYVATEQIYDDSANTWINKPNGLTFSNATGAAGELRHIQDDGQISQLNVGIGQIVRVYDIIGDDGVTNWMFAQRTELVPVKVTVENDPAGAGDGTTQCSFTYTVTDLDDVELLTAATPVWARPAVGKMTAATRGMAYASAGGVTILYMVDEVPDLEVCT